MTIERLEAAMATLRPRDREILLAHRLDGLSHEELAAVTGLSVREIEKAMARAIADLDRALCGQPHRTRRWW